MDVQELDGEARALFVRGLSASSRSTYGAGKRRYLSFCARANLDLLPASESTLCRFVAYLASEGLKAQLILGYLASPVDFAPRPRGECPRLAYVLKGVSRSQAAAPKPRRLPITPQILRLLKDAWERGTVDAYSARLFWAISLTAFFGYFRIGELTQTGQSTRPAVEVSDVSFEGNPVRARVHLRFSKTDPNGAGADIILGSTDDPLCPVTALWNCLLVRPAGPGALFASAGGSPVSRASFVAAVRATLLAAGMSSNGYTKHSFSIGAATSAARAGLATHLIKAMGRWPSWSTYVSLRRHWRGLLLGSFILLSQTLVVRQPSRGVSCN